MEELIIETDNGIKIIPLGTKILLEKEYLIGGLADNKSIDDIADRHDVPIDDIKDQIEKGIDVEHEHTNNSEIAKEIAKDHEWEDAEYYDKLKNINL